MPAEAGAANARILAAAKANSPARRNVVVACMKSSHGPGDMLPRTMAAGECSPYSAFLCGIATGTGRRYRTPLPASAGQDTRKPHDRTSENPQLCERGAYRPREIAPRRPPDPDDGRAVDPRDEGPRARSQ